MKETKANETTYEHIKIENGVDSEGKYLHIRVI